MKAIILAFTWSLLLISCREVSFPVAQPAGVPSLKEIPPALLGQYLSYDEKTGEESDTLIIESWGYHFKDHEDKDWLGQGHLSDTLVVKFYQDYYFVNFKSGNQWVLRLLQKRPSGGLRFLAIDLQNEEKRKDILARLGSALKIVEIKKGEDVFYQISPTPAQLMGLIREGYFTGPELSRIR